MTALLTLTHTTTGVGQGIVRSLTTALPGAGAFGSASVFIPRASHLFSGAYIDERGGSLVRIDHAELGAFEGYVDGPQGVKVEAGGVTLQVQDLAALTRTVSVTGGALTGLTAGMVAHQAFGQAFTGILARVVQAGGIYAGPPLLGYYLLKPATLDAALADIATYAPGQGWRIVERRFVWGPPRARSYPLPLVAGTDLFDDTLSVDTAGLLRAVTATSADGQPYTATAPENSQRLGALHEAITTEGTGLDAARQAADARLHVGRWERSVIKANLLIRRPGTERIINADADSPLARMLPQNTGDVVTGAAGHHWRYLREGDRVYVLTRTAGLGPRWAFCRLLSRSWSEGSNLMAVELQLLRPLTAASLTDGALLPERPVIARPGRGSVVQRLISLDRDVQRLRAV